MQKKKKKKKKRKKEEDRLLFSVGLGFRGTLLV